MQRIVAITRTTRFVTPSAMTSAALARSLMSREGARGGDGTAGTVGQSSQVRSADESDEPAAAGGGRTARLPGYRNGCDLVCGEIFWDFWRVVAE